MDNIALKNNIGRAFFFSILLHLFFIATVTIVIPEDLFMTEPFTRVTFLGPILEKTTFDIMVGGDVALGGSQEALVPGFQGMKDLNVEPPEPVFRTDILLFGQGRFMYQTVKGSLPGEKFSPDLFFKRIDDVAEQHKTGGLDPSLSHVGREVIYRPEEPLHVSVNGEIQSFKVKVQAFIDSSGKVVNPHVTVTSGSEAVDDKVLSYFSKWRFRPVAGVADKNDFFETEIIVDLEVSGEENDKA